MPATLTYPGVYITEKESGARAVVSAATSIAMFVGMADKGPFKDPTRVQSLAEFSRAFGETSAGEMADQVRQFFMNGGGDAYIMRVAKNAQYASVELEDETGANSVIKVTARDVGKSGNLIRVMIDYSTSSPERTFTLTAFRSTQTPDGKFDRTDLETHQNLSMNPDDPRYVVDYLKANSQLVRATDLTTPAMFPASGGTSVSGVIFSNAQAAADQDLIDIMTGSGNSFQISIGGRDPVLAVVDKAGMTTTASPDPTNPKSRILKAIKDAYLSAQMIDLGVTVEVINPSPTGLATGRVLEIRSTEGPVVITQAPTNDLATALMLGIPSGGVEMDQFTPVRPGPSGVAGRLGTVGAARATSSWLSRLFAFASSNRNDVVTFSLADPSSSASPYTDNITLSGTATDPILKGPVALSANALGTLENVRRALNEIAGAMNGKINDRWTAERQGLRLTLRPVTTVSPATGIGVLLTTGAAYNFGANNCLLQNSSSQNIGAYFLGTVVSPTAHQANTVPGDDGTKPGLAEYQDAFAIIDAKVEIFNMLVLPRADGQVDTDRQAIWGAASSFAAAQRSILFVDPDSDWNTIKDAADGADTIKVGIDTRNSVIYWPKLNVAAPDAPKGRIVDPSGSMAGLYARTDTRFGTWRAPAGIEATLTGVLGVTTPMSDPQNGQINPKALNAIRLFPSGITSWGARMMVGSDDTGNIDDKYVPVRRMMLFIENSLYRGLRFAVFRENAEPLWASIRLAAGSFMNSLMLQGAFASRTKSQAYYVLCDGTTTTATDINLGVVNVIVGFAPNKPAEFVQLIVTQMAGQIEV